MQGQLLPGDFIHFPGLGKTGQLLKGLQGDHCGIIQNTGVGRRCDAAVGVG